MAETERTFHSVLVDLYPKAFKKVEGAKDIISLTGTKENALIAQALTKDTDKLTANDSQLVVQALSGNLAELCGKGASDLSAGRQAASVQLSDITKKQWPQVFDAFLSSGKVSDLHASMTHKPRVLPLDVVSNFKQWARDKGVDLTLPTLPWSSEAESLNKHKETEFYRVKGQIYRSDRSEEQLFRIAFHSLFPEEPLSDGWQDRLRDRVKSIENKVTHEARFWPETPNNELADENFYVQALYDALDPSLTAPERKAYLTLYHLHNLTNQPDKEVSTAEDRELWSKALHAAPKDFRNDFFKALHEADLLLPFYVMAQRKDAFTDSYALRMCEVWADGNGINLIESFVNHQLLTIEDRDGQTYIREMPNSEIQAAADAQRAEKDAPDQWKQDNNFDPEAEAARFASPAKDPIKAGLDAIGATPDKLGADRKALDDASHGANPELIEALLTVSADVQKDIAADELNIFESGQKIRDIAWRFDIVPPQVVGRDGIYPNGKTIQDNVSLKERRASEAQLKRDLLHSTDPNKQALDLYTYVLFMPIKEMFDEYMSRSVENEPDYDPARLTKVSKKAAKASFGIYTAPELHEIFASLKRLGFQEELEMHFQKDGGYSSYLTRNIKRAYKKWLEQPEKEADMEHSSETANPELISAMLDISKKLDAGEVDPTSTPSLVKDIAEKFDLDLLPDEAAADADDQTIAGIKDPVRKSKAFAALTTKTRQIIKNRPNGISADQDAYNLYSGLVVLNRLDAAKGAHAYLGERADAVLAKTKREIAKHYKAFSVADFQSIFARFEEASPELLAEFARGFGKDAEYETILPKEIGKKLEKWKSLQARKFETQELKAGARQSVDDFGGIPDAVLMAGGEDPSDAAINVMKHLGINYQGADQDSNVPPPVDLKDNALDAIIARKQVFYNFTNLDILFDAKLNQHSVKREVYDRHNGHLQKETAKSRKHYLEHLLDTVQKTKFSHDVKAVLIAQYIVFHSFKDADKITYEREGDFYGRTFEDYAKDSAIYYRRTINSPTRRRKFFNAANEHGQLADLYFLAGRPDTYFPDNTRDLLNEWCKKQGIDLKQLLVDHQIPSAEKKLSTPAPDKPVQKLSMPSKRWKKNLTPAFEATGGDEGYVQARRNKIAERDARELEEVGPKVEVPKLSEPKEGWVKDLSLAFVGVGGGDDSYVGARKHFTVKHKEKYPLEEIEAQEPYDAEDNHERDILRTYVPGLLPEGKSDHDVAGELTGDFGLSAPVRGGKREVVIQRERRDLIIEDWKQDPEIKTIHEFTHPNFDTEEGRYYTVLHAKKRDGSWTQAAVSIAEGDPALFAKHRMIVDSTTGKCQRSISDLREDLFVQRVKYSEDYPESYQARGNEIVHMSLDEVPEDPKSAIAWTKLQKYGDKVANQIHNSLSDHIRKTGEGVDKNLGVVKTGDTRKDYDDEHPSLFHRTRWGRVFWALDEEKVTGMEHVKTRKQLLHWAVEKDGTLLECLNEDVQEWLLSPDEEYEPPVKITSADEALDGKEPANDDDRIVELDPTREYTAGELKQILGLE